MKGDLLHNCRYDKNGTCVLLKELGISCNTKGRWCEDRCQPNNINKQIKMLFRLGIALYGIPPVGIDLIDWIKQQANEDKIKISKTKPCKGCGEIKNIIKGFGSLIWQRISKGKRDDHVIKRAEICNECEHRTFLNVMEWGIGFVTQGDLPINHEPGEWDVLWCSKCKCCIEAKIRAKDERCILEKWGGVNET